jgi:hypothetical protein
MASYASCNDERVKRRLLPTSKDRDLLRVAQSFSVLLP